MLRALGVETIAVYLNGADSVLDLPPPVIGDQPSDEKFLGFPQILGFHVEQVDSPLAIFGVGVDETTQ